MTLILTQPAVISAAPLAEIKSYLRLETADEDAMLAALFRTALALAEDFLGEILLTSSWREVRSGVLTFTLQQAPFQSLTTLSLTDSSGTVTLIDPRTVILQLTDHDEAMLSLPTMPQDRSRLTIDYVAGLATEWNGLPEPIRLGILRQTVHLFAHRDDPADAGIALAATALWRPYKRLRLV